jgi:effector-binding domain-containing protein
MFDEEIKEVEPMTAAVIAMTGPYAQMPEAMGTLYGWVEQHGYTPVGMPMAVYLTMPSEVPESAARWEVYAPIAEDSEAVPAAEPGDVGVVKLEAKTVASAMHKGPYESVGSTYEALMAWLTGQGYVVCGPPAEIYHSDPADVPPSEYLTEIHLPVCRRD